MHVNISLVLARVGTVLTRVFTVSSPRATTEHRAETHRLRNPDRRGVVCRRKWARLPRLSVSHQLYLVWLDRLMGVFVDWKWRFLFSQQVYAQVADALVNAQAPTYETVLDLDRRIRQTTLPAVRLYLTPDEDDYNNPGLCMKGYLMSQYRSICASFFYLLQTQVCLTMLGP